jgi:hypothetical protein
MRHLVRIITGLCLLATTLLQAHSALADEDRAWYQRAEDEVVRSYREGDPYFYLPFRTYHMRHFYTQEQIDNYQEHPFGLGYGRGGLNKAGNWTGVYAMGFQDSHFLPQWMIGYNWMYSLHLFDDVRAEIGYAAFITTRADYAHYSPVPGIVPVASVGIHRLSLEASYVPGGKSFGNILFFWAKYRLNS